MTKDIKPCPFCGGEAEIAQSDFSKMRMVSCKNCDSQGPYGYPEEQALKAWNTRA